MKDFFSQFKIKTPKIEKIKIQKLHMTKQGERTLTSVKKRKLMESVGYRCQECGKSFKHLPKYLEIHHKKGIREHKSQFGYDLPVYSMGKKIKPKYDRRSNLQVLCKDCHDKTKGKKVKKKNPFAFGI